ncbi:peptide/nickel transport system ATP-binding protein [Aquamicrobium lusatiense]|uniref:Peptide/nickel transport system ATP-binding protein n=1 Tax=Aquamicrobium lusatiense TaxID=89772 RepID=A0A7W9S4F4_9HYPH|nr:ABC transporter ATP-binding protein [Aquamicrobium lusatiense]MBB6013932.1 peptide/nickel transport system ATP-binding protein [Aquamicrobium lusatiense]
MLLDVHDLHVTLPDQGRKLRAVRGVDLSVAAGETLCLVGESGCGKSMTALALMGLLPRRAERRAARLRLGLTDLGGLSDGAMSALRGRRMSMIFQEPMTALNPVFTIGDQLCSVYRRHTRASGAAARARAIDVLESVGLTNAALRMRQYPHQLSGGLRQRVLIAMALICEPELMICDEPTTALDVTTQAQILHILKEAQAARNMGMIFITHDLGVVARIADRVAVMYAGRVVEEGTREAVLRHPAHPYTRGLIASVPKPGGGEPGQTRLASIAGNVPAFHQEDARCPFLSRCLQRMDVCAETPPPVRQAPAGQSFACHLLPGWVESRAAGVEKRA